MQSFTKKQTNGFNESTKAGGAYLTIGRAFNTSEGKFSEIILFNVALDTTNKMKLENNQSNYYRITLS